MSEIWDEEKGLVVMPVRELLTIVDNWRHPQKMFLFPLSKPVAMQGRL